jgi:hypothetical protein
VPLAAGWQIDSISASYTPPCPASTDLRVSLTGPTSARKGSWVSYTLQVTNGGEAAATDVTAVIGAAGLSNLTTTPETGTGSVNIGGNRLLALPRSRARTSKPAAEAAASGAHLWSRWRRERGSVPSPLPQHISGTADPEGPTIASCLSGSTVLVFDGCESPACSRTRGRGRLSPVRSGRVGDRLEMSPSGESRSVDVGGARLPPPPLSGVREPRPHACAATCGPTTVPWGIGCSPAAARLPAASAAMRAQWRSKPAGVPTST